MTVRELRDVLLKVECEGFEDAAVEMCQFENNPMNDAREFVGIVQLTCINYKQENSCKVVLMYE